MLRFLAPCHPRDTEKTLYIAVPSQPQLILPPRQGLRRIRRCRGKRTPPYAPRAEKPGGEKYPEWRRNLRPFAPKRRRRRERDGGQTPGAGHEWKRSQARSQIRRNSSRFAFCDSGLSRPSPKGPRRVGARPVPRGGLPPSSYSARVRRLLVLRLPSTGREWPFRGEGGVGGWCPP